MIQEETQRLFIAIDLPDGIKARLHETQQALREHTRAVRWADPQGTHLTLKFLGEVRVGAIGAIEAGMARAAARHRSFALRTTELGAFPSKTRPRVVWLGLGGDLAVLRELRADVERSVAPLGFPTEQRSFAPHLTLGRSGKEPRPADLETIGQALDRVAAPAESTFFVQEIVLMRSELGKSGARYTPVVHVPLGTAADRAMV